MQKNITFALICPPIAAFPNFILDARSSVIYNLYGLKEVFCKEGFFPLFSSNVLLLILVPSRPPENIRGIALTTTSMSFEWDPVLPGFLHGLLTSYQLRVVETDNPSNEIVSESLSPFERSYYVENLKKYTNYTMWVTASNSKGEGPNYPLGHTYSTGEDGKTFFVYMSDLCLCLLLPSFG